MNISKLINSSHFKLHALIKFPSKRDMIDEIN